MISCDLCKTSLFKMSKPIPHVALDKTGNHICEECIQWCKRIMKDPDEKDNKIICLNEYRDKKKWM
jgi:hypothetical protein